MVHLKVEGTSNVPKIYEPTMRQLKDFSNYFSKIEAQDKEDKIGAVKIKMPKQYFARKSGYGSQLPNFKIENALEQKFQIVSPGCYQTLARNVPTMTLKEYRRLATSKDNQPPDGVNIEKSYWEG